MKNIRPLVVALCMNMSIVGMAVVPHVVMAADKQEVGVKVGKPLQEAQKAAQEKRFDDALAKLREAEAVAEKTPFEQHKINEFFQYVYIQQKKYGEAAAVTEKLIDDGLMSPSEVDTSVKQVFQMYSAVKNNAKAMEYLQRWLKSHPGDPDMTAYLGQLQAQSGQQKQALETLGGLVSSTEKAGGVPKEDWLKIMYGLSFKASGNNTSYDKQTLGIIEKLVRYYPNENYWGAMLSGLKNQATSDASKFQLYRLMLSVGILKDANDYIEMAQLANNFGYPGEANNVLDAGFAKGVLGTGPGKDREERLRATIKKAAEADKGSLPALEKKASAAATGQDDASLGEAYLGYGQYPQAIEALERGIKKGGLKKEDQAEIALGIAYLRSNQADKARASFKQVTGDSDLGRIASLWGLHASAKR